MEQNKKNETLPEVATKTQTIKVKSMGAQLAESCLEHTGLEWRIFCGMKKIETLEVYLKTLNGGQGKTIDQLTEVEKKEAKNKWEMGEVLQVLEDLRASNINPLMKTVYFVKVGGKADYWLDYSFGIERAQNSNNFDGDENGIIIETKEGEILHRTGSWTTSNDKLIGGWAKVWRKDRKYPVIVEVGLSEFWNDNNPMWNKKAAYLINKCAINNAYKRAFPKECRNIGDKEIEPEIIDTTYTEVTTSNILQPVKPETKPEPAAEPEQKPEEKNPFEV